MRKVRKAMTAATGAMVAVLLGGGVAPAEGGFTSGISGWLTGKESRHWGDNNTDSASTTVTFSGCSVSGASRFRSATLQLKKERSALPDPVVGRDDNHCDTSDFGRQGRGKYYFNLSRINGTDSGLSLTVRKVSVQY